MGLRMRAVGKPDPGGGIEIPLSPHSQTHYICPFFFVIFFLEVCVECSQL